MDRASATEREIGPSTDAKLPPLARAAKRILDASAAVRRRRGAGALVAVVTFAAALLLRWLVDDYLPPGFPFLTFFPAVLASAFLGGVYPAVLCAVLSGLAAWVWFIPPYGRLSFEAASVTAMLFYVAIATVNIALIAMLTSIVGALGDERRKLALGLDRQRELFSELQHRVGNNLSLIAALIGLQRRKLKQNREAAGALDDARFRIDAMGRIHRRLFDPANEGAPVASHLKDLADHLILRSGAQKIALKIDAAPDVQVERDTLMTLSLALVEILGSALRRPDEPREGGEITLRLHRLDAESVGLTVVDHYAPSGSEQAMDDVAERLSTRFAESLGGGVTVDAGDGVRATRIVFRLPTASPAE